MSLRNFTLVNQFKHYPVIFSFTRYVVIIFGLIGDNGWNILILIREDEKKPFGTVFLQLEPFAEVAHEIRMMY